MQATLRAKRRAVKARLAREDDANKQDLAIEHAKRIVAGIGERFGKALSVDVVGDEVYVLRDGERVGSQSVATRLERHSWMGLRAACMSVCVNERVERAPKPTRYRAVDRTPWVRGAITRTARQWLVQRTRKAIARLGL